MVCHLGHRHVHCGDFVLGGAPHDRPRLLFLDHMTVSNTIVDQMTNQNLYIYTIYVINTILTLGLIMSGLMFVWLDNFVIVREIKL